MNGLVKGDAVDDVRVRGDRGRRKPWGARCRKMFATTPGSPSSAMCSKNSQAVMTLNRSRARVPSPRSSKSWNASVASAVNRSLGIVAHSAGLSSASSRSLDPDAEASVVDD